MPKKNSERAPAFAKHPKFDAAFICEAVISLGKMNGDGVSQDIGITLVTIDAFICPKCDLTHFTISDGLNDSIGYSLSLTAKEAEQIADALINPATTKARFEVRG